MITPFHHTEPKLYLVDPITNNILGMVDRDPLFEALSGGNFQEKWTDAIFVKCLASMFYEYPDISVSQPANYKSFVEPEELNQ